MTLLPLSLAVYCAVGLVLAVYIMVLESTQPDGMTAGDALLILVISVIGWPFFMWRAFRKVEWKREP